MIDRDDANEARRKFEARHLTAEGFVWPVQRAFMRHAGTIRARMVEDLLRAKVHAPDGGPHTALAAAGWMLAQIAACADAAIAEFERRPKNRRE